MIKSVRASLVLAASAIALAACVTETTPAPVAATPPVVVAPAATTPSVVVTPRP